MNFTKLSIRLTQLLFALMPLCMARAAPIGTPPTAQGFEWIDLSDCRVPRVKPPRLRPESDDGYLFQRRFLALDEGPLCVLMETYVERLDGSDSPGMRVRGARAYRFEQGKWKEGGVEFLYFPYALRRQQDQHVYFVEAVLEDDVGDSAAVVGWSPSVFQRTAASAGGARAGAWRFKRLFQPEGAVLQGLAVLLHERLRAGSLKRRSHDELEVERRRIRLLLQSAWEHLPPSERVAVDADGLPR